MGGPVPIQNRHGHPLVHLSVDLLDIRRVDVYDKHRVKCRLYQAIHRNLRPIRGDIDKRLDLGGFASPLPRGLDEEARDIKCV